MPTVPAFHSVNETGKPRPSASIIVIVRAPGLTRYPRVNDVLVQVSIKSAKIAVPVTRNEPNVFA